MSAWIPDLALECGSPQRSFTRDLYSSNHEFKIQFFSDYGGTLSEMNRHYYLNLGYSMISEMILR